MIFYGVTKDLSGAAHMTALEWGSHVLECSRQVVQVLKNKQKMLLSSVISVTKRGEIL